MPRSLLFLIMSLLLLASCQDDAPSTAKDRQLEDFEHSPYAWGFVSKDGAFVIDPVFDDALDFREGLAAVNKDGLWGYIDINGRPRIDFHYLSAHSFYNGLARVRNENGLWGLLDKTGQYALKPEWSAMDDPISPLTRVKNEHGFTFIDMEGLKIHHEVYSYASPFINGCAVVQAGESYTLLQEDGQLLGEFEELRFTPSGLLPFREGQKWGYTDRNGRVRITAQYDRVWSFKDQVSIIRHGDTYKAIDTSGQVLCTSMNHLENLGEGLLAEYTSNDKVCIINKLGEKTPAPPLDEVHLFSEERAPIRMDTLWSFMEPSGDLIRPVFSSMVWPYKNGLARCIMDNGIGFIDREGKVVVPGHFFEVKDFSSSGLARAQAIR